MPLHKVSMNLPWREIGHSDVEFKIYKGATLLGKIRISKGAIEWYKHKAKKPTKMSWTRFDKLMNGDLF